MRATLRRSFSVLAAILVLLLLLPYLIVPLYRFGQPVSTPMLWRWATGSRVERVFVPLGRIAPTLPLAVIVAEDGSFCRNRGIDLGAIREALQQADEDIDEARGGSTITQQTAKNLFLWQGRSFVRKALEIPLALWINLVLPKRRVLEIYLNIAEWGPNGEFGAEAARALGLRQIGGRSHRAGSRRNLPRSCRIRSGAARGRRARGCAGWPASTSAAPPLIRRLMPASAPRPLASAEPFFYKRANPQHSDLHQESDIMAVPKRKTSPSRRGMRRSADALKRPAYIEDKDSGELRRPHHIDLKTGMYRGRQVLKKKTEA